MTGITKRIRILGVILVILAVASAAYFRFRTPPDFPQTIQLPDGSELTVLAATFGTNHVSPGRISIKLYERLPNRLVNLLGIPSPVIVSSPEPTLCVWFRRRNTSSNSVPGSECTFSLVDLSGFESMVDRRSPVQQKVGVAEYVEGYTFRAFPRESPTVRLRLTQRSLDSPPVRIGEFRFANPAYPPLTRYPVWQSGPSTVGSASGALEVTLRSFAVGLDWDTNEPVSKLVSYRDLKIGEAVFDIRKNGQITTNWMIKGFEISDATGNQMRPATWTYYRAANHERVVGFLPTLWPNGSVWKIFVEFSPGSGAVYGPGESVTFMVKP
jgi:hypothetical protein